MENEKKFKGILGGLLGSLAGVVAIIFFYKLGYVAAAAGLVMAVCTIGLYKKFNNGTIDKKGIITCIVIMMVMSIVGYNLAFCMALLEELEAFGIESDVIYLFFKLYSLIGQGLIETSTYVGGLVMLLFFNVLGSVGVFKDQIKELKNKNNPVTSQPNFPNVTPDVNNQMNTNNVYPQNNMNNNINPMANQNNMNYNNVQQMPVQNNMNYNNVNQPVDQNTTNNNQF